MECLKKPLTVNERPCDMSITIPHSWIHKRAKKEGKRSVSALQEPKDNDPKHKPGCNGFVGEPRYP